MRYCANEVRDSRPKHDATIFSIPITIDTHPQMIITSNYTTFRITEIFIIIEHFVQIQATRTLWIF